MQVDFGPVITGPDNGTLVVQANPGDILRIIWALGTDSSIDIYRGLVFGVEGVSGVDTAEITRVGGSALELTGQGSSLRIDAVPEPGSLLLLGSGLVALAGIRRKQRGFQP